MLVVLLCALIAQDPAGTTVADIAQLTVSPPRVVAELDTGKIAGTPTRLAWGPDATLYIRITETDRWANERNKHFIVTPTDKAMLRPVDGEPSWVAAYWLWKTALVAPGVPTMKIDVEERRDRKSVVNTPGGADLAGMASGLPPGAAGQGVSQGVAAKAANNSYTVDLVTVRFKGQVLAEWSDKPQPGLQLAWAPAPMGVLSYVDGKRHLVLVDRDGRKREVTGAVEVVLPAWSPDGRQIAFLQQTGKKKYSLTLVDVGR